MKLSIALVIAAFSAVVAADPLVIAHRGASGYLPEHTLEAYALAIDQGADYIEPDLVFTADGVLIARHDNYLSTTTDVAQRAAFAARKKQKGDREDWFTEDFTLSEIKSLRAIQSFGGRSAGFDGQYQIPTFQEVIDLVRQKERETGREIGIYPETKLPSHFESLGFDFAGTVVAVLDANGLNRASSPVFIQSFEPEILRRLNDMTDVPLVMLVTPRTRDDVHTPNIPLEEIRQFADGVGASKILLMNQDGESSGFVEQAQALGLFVHAWTFRDDAYPEALFDNGADEIRQFLEIGMDGFFTDFPDTGVKARDTFVNGE